MTLPPLETLADQLAERLTQPLPGLPAQLEMAPPIRGRDEEVLRQRSETAQPAGVIVLLYPQDDGIGFVLTLRQKALHHHSGQVSLPGGRLEPGETPLDTALRECQEEVGVDPTSIRVLGQLTDIYIPPSDFIVTPIVSFVDEKPIFIREETEVAAIIEVPLTSLLDDSCRTTADWRIQGRDMKIPLFRLEGYEVWGATAMILAEFCRVLRAL